MKKTIYFLTAAIFAVGTILTGCKPSAEKVENAEENVSEAKQDLTEAKIDYKGVLPESLLDAYQKMGELDDEAPRKEYKKERRENKNALP